jgi:hypothetical protein
MDRDKFGRFLKGGSIGKKHWAWKGSRVGYQGVHGWVRRTFKKDKCCKCGSKENLDYANISGKYKRDISDWKVMCKKCHHIFDNVYEKMMATRKRNGSRFAKVDYFCSVCKLKGSEYPSSGLCKKHYMERYDAKRKRKRLL